MLRRVLTSPAPTAEAYAYSVLGLPLGADLAEASLLGLTGRINSNAHKYWLYSVYCHNR